MPNATTIELNDKNETDQEKLNIRRIISGAEVYYNFTGDLKCLDLGDQDRIGADLWDYQVYRKLFKVSYLMVNFPCRYNTIIYLGDTFLSVMYRNGNANVFQRRFKRYV